jgi:alpha 1,2-mannosyltransferase
MKEPVVQFFLILLVCISCTYQVPLIPSKNGSRINFTPNKRFLLKSSDFTPIVETESNARANAAIVILVRNSEKDEIIGTLQNFQEQFNNQYNYPYVFLNDELFTDDFKDGIVSQVSANVEFGLVPQSHWSYPLWINQTKAAECRTEMGDRDIIYGYSESYRHMCRYFSGFFFRHELLSKYDYYWRIEPSVRFLCKIDFDPFVYMQETGKKYSFVISLDEFWETIPTLWKVTKEFIQSRKLEPSWFNYFQDDQGDYNLCHFWSNFEIGDLRFFRSQRYLDYFNFLDQKGGFFYERWGDAPVHSLAVGLFLKKSEVLFFNDIGYHHAPFKHCPLNPLFESKCNCDLGVQLDESGQDSCVGRFLNYVPERSEDGSLETIFD